MKRGFQKVEEKKELTAHMFLALGKLHKEKEMQLFKKILIDLDVWQNELTTKETKCFGYRSFFLFIDEFH